MRWWRRDGSRPRQAGDILKFLAARLDDDEQAARAVIDAGCRGTWDAVPVLEEEGRPALVEGSYAFAVMDPVPEAWPAATHAARHDPARVLAEIEAKRRVVEDYERKLDSRRAHPDDLASAGALLALHGTVKLLATVYSDHPDYDPEGWAPHPTYGGPVTVRLNNRQHVEGHADLQLHSDSADDFGRRLWSWDGTIRVDTFDTAMEALQEGHRIAVVMPDGTTAEALPCAITEPDPVIEIQGIGPAPWDTSL